MDSDYVINIILRARDEIAGTVAKATAEISAMDTAAGKSSGLDSMNDKAERLAQTVRTKAMKAFEDLTGQMRESGNEVDKYEKKFGSLSKQVEDTNKKLSQTGGFTKLNGELDKSRSKLDDTVRGLANAENALRDAEKAQDDFSHSGERSTNAQWRHQKAVDAAREAVERESQSLRSAEKDFTNNTRALSDYSKEAEHLGKITTDLNRTTEEHSRSIKGLTSDYERQVTALAKMQEARKKIGNGPNAQTFDFGSFDKQITDQEAKVYGLASKLNALKDVGIEVHLDTKDFDAEALNVEITKKKLQGDAEIHVKADIAEAVVKLEAVQAAKNKLGNAPMESGGGGFKGWLGSLQDSLDSNGHSIASFDNGIRGLLYLGAAASGQQLLTLLTSLGGELVSVGSSAIFAGSALGGALTAGAAEALPVVGLLVSSLTRVAAVISAVKQTETMRQQESYKSETGEGAELSANEGVVSATEAVTAARENLRIAETNLTKSRFEARRGLEDLIATERQAELAAKGATLSQIESNVALRAAMTGGSILEYAQAQINVQEARENVTTTRSAAGRAHQNVRLQERNSPLRPDTSVEQAERGVSQGRTGLKQAERSAGAAGRAAQEAANKEIASTGKLNFMLGELDSTEKQLYKDARKLYQVYKEVTRPITDVLTSVFDKGAKKATALLKDPELDGAFKHLADTMGSNFERVLNVFSDPKWVHFFSEMTDDASENIGPLTNTFINLAETFRAIAEAASPVLHDILGWIEKGSEEFEEWVGSGTNLEEFFKEGEVMLEAWLSLTHAVIDLFLALIGDSAKQGTEQVEDLTGKIHEATQWLEDHKETVEEFFHDVGEVMAALGGLLVEIGGAILKAFNVENTKALIDLVSRVFVPALAQALEIFGGLVKLVDDIAKTEIGGEMFRFIAGAAILTAVLKPVLQSVYSLYSTMKSIVGVAADLAGKLLGIPASVRKSEGSIGALKQKLGGTTWDEEGNVVSGPQTAEEAGKTSRLSKLGGRALGGLAIAGTGLAIGQTIGGKGGKAISYAAVGAGLGMFAGPEGAAIGAGLGVVADGILELFGSEKKLTPVQEEMNELTEAYPGLAKEAGSAAEQLKENEEGISTARDEAKTATHEINNLEEKLAELREKGGGHNQILKVEQELAKARQENNHALREQHKLENAAPQIRGNTAAATERALSNVDVRKRVEERHLNAIAAEEKEKGYTPELTEKFLARNSSVEKLRKEAQAYTKTLASLGPKSRDAAKEINQSFLASKYGIKGKGLYSQLESIKKEFEGYGGEARLAAEEANGGFIAPWFKQIHDKLIAAEEQVQKFKAHLEKPVSVLLKLRMNASEIRKAAAEAVKNINPRQEELSGQRKALGGPIGAGFGGGDRVPIVGEEGEHMLTKEDVRNAGGHSAIFAIRALLSGAATQSSGNHMAAGGVVSSSGSGSSISLEGVLELIETFGGSALSTWDSIWDSMQSRTDKGTASIEHDFTQMEKSLSGSAGKTEKAVVKSFSTLFSDVSGDINQLTHVVYNGLSYVAEITEKALQGFGVKKISLSIPKPKGAGQGGGKGAESKAEGGFIGNQGERGGDFVPTWLGRGEAVLNWGHQHLVEPAMRAYHGFGLNEMFKSSNTSHGFGGAGAGFAKGRAGMSTSDLFEGHPSDVASSLRKLIEIMKTKWPMLMVTATTDHSLMTSSGNVSDHSTGHAVDLARPMDSSGIAYMDKAAAWVKTSGLYKQIKQGIHNPDLAIEEGVIETPPGIYAGATWEEHLNHIHLAVHDALSGKFGGGIGQGAAAKALKSLQVKGSEGIMKAIAQSAITKAVKAATKKINKSMSFSDGDSGTDGYISGGVSGDAEHNAKAIMKALMGHGLSKLQAAGITGNALQESGWMPGSIGSGGGGLWGFTAGEISLSSLQSYAASKKKPWTDIGLQVEFLLEHVDPSVLAGMASAGSPGAAAAYFQDNWEHPLASSENQANRELGARQAFSGEYAHGGAVDGSGGAGKGIPILAHLGEWILNEGQQHRIASMLGVSVDKLKGMMGFSGGPIAYAGGGEPNSKSKGKKSTTSKPSIGESESTMAAPMVDFENFKAALGYYAEEVGKEITEAKEALQEATTSKKPAEAIGKFVAKSLGELEASLEAFKEAWEMASKEMVIRLAKAAVRVGKGGKILGAGMNPAQLLELEIKDAYKEVEFLFAQRGPILKGLNLANKALKAAKKSGSKKAEEVAQNAIVNYKKLLHENELSVAEAQRNVLEKQQTRENESVTKIIEGGERKLGKDASSGATFKDLAGEEGKLKSALGRAKKHRNRELAKSIEAELTQLESVAVESINIEAEKSMESAFGENAEMSVIAKQSDQLNAALSKAKHNRNEALVRQIEQEQHQLESEAVESINKNAEGANNFRTSRASIASAFGYSGAAAQWNQYTIGVMEQQSHELEGALGKARSNGNAALAGQIEAEMQNIEVSIAEATAAFFQSSIEQVEKHFSHQAALRGMVEQIQNAQATVIGNSAYSAQLRQGQLYGERAEEGSQLSETQRLLSEAISQGFGPDVTEPLEEKIWSLTGAIEENSANLYTNSIAIRQAYIGQIQGKGSFQTGVFGTLESIVTGLGALSGTVNQAKLIQLIMETGNSLRGTGWELRGQLGAFDTERLAGTANGSAVEGLLGLEGEALVTAIQSLNIRGIEEQLGNEELIGQFRELIDTILENEVAVIGNTKALEEAMQEQKIQSFTSSAWSFFRSALFNGMGGLMPEYAAGTPFYSADSGGEVTGDGPINAHRGEIILPRNYSSILKGLANAGTLASGLGSGSMTGLGLGNGLGVGQGLSSAASAGMTNEIAALREELSRRTQEINTYVTEAEPTDPAYTSSLIAFKVKNPAT